MTGVDPPPSFSARFTVSPDDLLGAGIDLHGEMATRLTRLNLHKVETIESKLKALLAEGVDPNSITLVSYAMHPNLTEIQVEGQPVFQYRVRFKVGGKDIGPDGAIE